MLTVTCWDWINFPLKIIDLDIIPESPGKSFFTLLVSFCIPSCVLLREHMQFEASSMCQSWSVSVNTAANTIISNFSDLKHPFGWLLILWVWNLGRTQFNCSVLPQMSAVSSIISSFLIVEVFWLMSGVMNVTKLCISNQPGCKSKLLCVPSMQISKRRNVNSQGFWGIGLQMAQCHFYLILLVEVKQKGPPTLLPFDARSYKVTLKRDIYMERGKVY